MRLSRFLGIGFFALAFALPAAAATPLILVTNSAGDSVNIVDPTTNTVVHTIEGIEVPHGVAASPDGTRIYVSNESRSTLDVIDAKTGKAIAAVPLSGHPNNIAVTKDGGRVIVCIAQRPAFLDVVDTQALKVKKAIPMRDAMHNPYITPDQKFAVAGSVRGKFLVVVDLATEEVVWQLDPGKGVRPMAIEAGPDGSTSRIFVQLTDLNGFAVVDFAKRDIVQRIELPDNGYGKIERRLDSPSHGIGIAPDGKTLWVTSLMANGVYAYSLPDLKLLGSVMLPDEPYTGHALGSLPNWVTFTPDGKRLYVSDSGLRSVSAIDTQAMKLVATVPVGEVPKRIGTLVLP